MNKMALLVD